MAAACLRARCLAAERDDGLVVVVDAARVQRKHGHRPVGLRDGQLEVGAGDRACQIHRPPTARVMLVPEIWPVSRSSQLELMRDHGLTTAKYEWMFWDAGWRCETWPI